MRLLGLFSGLLLLFGGFRAEKETLSPQFLSGVILDSLDTIQGIDVSHHQKDIQWWRISKVNFVFIKATEGISRSDERFKENWDSSKSHGILRGAYHFYRPSVSAKDQFKHFSSRVILEKGDLPPVLDAEVGHRYPERLRREYLSWLILAEKHYGVVPIIYCTHSFYQKYFNSPEFDKYPLWIANYSVDNLTKITSRWHFWQHTAEGEVEGVQGPVDLNVFRGNYDSLLSLSKK